MTTFQFSEAAQLYAQHEPIVTRLHARLTAEATAFWDAVKDGLGRRCEPRAIVRTDTQGYTYLRLRDNAADPASEIASIWIARAADGDLVRSKLRVAFGSARASSKPGALRAAAAVGDDVARLLDGTDVRVHRRKPTVATLFEIELALGGDPVTSACDAIAPVLMAIAEVASSATS